MFKWSLITETISIWLSFSRWLERRRFFSPVSVGGYAGVRWAHPCSTATDPIHTDARGGVTGSPLSPAGGVMPTPSQHCSCLPAWRRHPSDAFTEYTGPLVRHGPFTFVRPFSIRTPWYWAQCQFVGATWQSRAWAGEVATEPEYRHQLRITNGSPTT